MVQLETTLMVLSSENQFWLKISHVSLRTGINQSLLEDMLSVMFTTVLTSKFLEQDNFQQHSKDRMDNKPTKSTISKEKVLH